VGCGDVLGDQEKDGTVASGQTPLLVVSAYHWIAVAPMQQTSIISSWRRYCTYEQ